MSKPQHPHTKAQLVKATKAKSALAKVVSNDNNDKSTAKSSPQTDAAVLIGLAMAFGRQRGSSAVPNVVLAPLTAAADAGCGASQMVTDFLECRALKANGNTNVFVVGAGQGLHSIPADRKDGAVYDGGKAHV